MKTIGEALHLVMLLRGLTQTELSRATNVSQGHISLLFGGHREPSDEQLRAIQLALNISAQQLEALLKRYHDRTVDDAYQTIAWQITQGYLKSLA